MLLLALFIALGPAAHACSIVGPTEHTVDPESTDTVAPGPPTVTSFSVTRGRGPRRVGLGCQGVSSCDDLGFIDIVVSGADDQSTAAELGFRVVDVEGVLPDGLDIGTTFVEVGGLSWAWIDDATDDQEAFDFVLTVVAVDGAGNEGEPTEIPVSDPGSGAGRGCSHGGGLAIGVATVLAVGAARRRRRG